MGEVAALFWFYRDLPVCQNRLDLLRRENPNTKIFGLYGGDPQDAERFRNGLPGLDDFWAFDRDETPKWKWRHGDLMLAAWFDARGKQLAWDHVFVVQWDMLVLKPIDEIVPSLEPDDVLLSGTCRVAEIEQTWVWTRGGHAPDYQAFLDALESSFGPTDPVACLFVIACLPRSLLSAYGRHPEMAAGFIEYRLPTFATALGLRLVQDPNLSSWSPADGRAGPASRRDRFLNGHRHSILLPQIVAELVRSDGVRVFHPYHGLFPVDARWGLKTPVWGMYQSARAGKKALSARVAKLRR